MQNWQMQEVLCFPAHFGTVQQGSVIKVEPNWHSEMTESSIVLKGVYVLKGSMQFDFKEREETEQEGTFIEHLAIEKDEAYFEYAIPFSIDIPNNDVENVNIKALQSTVDVNEQGQCVCSWQVHCDVEKKAQPNEEIAMVKEDLQLEPVMKKEIKSEPIVEVTQSDEPIDYVKAIIEESPQLSSEEVDFLEQLAEAYSVVQVHLNKEHK